MKELDKSRVVKLNIMNDMLGKLDVSISISNQMNDEEFNQGRLDKGVLIFRYYRYGTFVEFDRSKLTKIPTKESASCKGIFEYTPITRYYYILKKKINTLDRTLDILNNFHDSFPRNSMWDVAKYNELIGGAYVFKNQIYIPIYVNQIIS